ncbi:MAG: hypothetical protein GF375_02825 [Candidatus Omnitrophica bacterium]|nr:hypothetical protein [Candidatus Omnitrophota bacterium]MBD3269030.1 hypothetical protein [Candidatus Omnitrophota bacterium]
MRFGSIKGLSGWFFLKILQVVKDFFLGRGRKTTTKDNFESLIRKNRQRIELVTFEDFCRKSNINPDREDIAIKYPPLLVSKAVLLSLYSEIYALCSLAKKIKAKNVFEIGTFEGKTSANIANNLEEGAVIHTLDFPLYKHLIDKESVGRYIKEDPKASAIVKIIESDSLLFDFSPFYNKIDIMYIDGGTSYRCVFSDSENALKCVKRGGFILWHDFLAIGKCYEGLVAAVFDFALKHDLKLYLLDGTRLVVTQV